MRRPGRTLPTCLVAILTIASTACSGDTQTPRSRDVKSTSSTTTHVLTGVTRTRLVSECPQVQPPWSQTGKYAPFFGSERRVVWLPTAAGRCLYELRPGAETARAIWKADAETAVSGVMWSPANEQLLLTVRGSKGDAVERLDANGQSLATIAARSATWTTSGQVVIQRSTGLFLVTRSGLKKIISTTALEDAAGFAGRPNSIGEDTLGYERGAGDSAVAVTWSSSTPPREVTLVVGLDGAVARATPVFRGTGSRAGGVGGLSWSPDGRQLYLLLKAPTPQGFSYDHDHCVMRWDRSIGFRTTFCMTDLPQRYRHHFDKLIWSADGSRGLLNDGTVINHDGEPLSHLRAKPTWGAFSAHWK
ncbi:MAG TPA: hypothetical protein VFJ93_05340 [Gaiellaceae bacterium]|nr:hypothetical protein [Gaiellaceae bacterium]